MYQRIMEKERAAELIADGRPLLVAGDETALGRLPEGDWIGGTTPYFMWGNQRIFTRDQLCVTQLPLDLPGVKLKHYDNDLIARVYTDAPENGFSVIILPALSATHLSFALNAPNYEGFAMRPLIGWIAGVALEAVEKVHPKVFKGGILYSEGAVVMHVSLPPDQVADMGIHNRFEPGGGDRIYFLEDSFSASEVLINGQRRSFARYIQETGLNTEFPLVGDYFGTSVNTSFMAVDPDQDRVNFYAPVFKDLEYQHARAVPGYEDGFQTDIPAGIAEKIVFSFNCILNQPCTDRPAPCPLQCPFTFGEVAYQLLNQTLVYLTVEKAAKGILD